MADTLLTQIRKSRGLSLDDVAGKVGTTAGTLSRVERGEQTPKKELARALHEFFGGAVPLGAVYDAAYPD
jgi:transcriptional regulator with XRE-family HTH domain